MKKYGKLFGTVLALIAVIGLASFAYGKLKEKTETPAPIVNNETEKEDSASNEEPETEDTATQRQEAIDVKFYDSEGASVNLSDFYGKPVVMNFWATWCGYCKEEMPDFQEAFDEYGDKVNFLFINSTDGQRETREKATAYLDEQGYTLPAYYDEDLEAVYTYSVNSLPTTILLDKEGRIAGYAPGLMPKETLVQALDILLNE